MNRKLYWGLAALSILIIGATVFVVVKNNTEMQQLKEELADFEKQAVERDKPPPAPEGYKWVQHGDHHHLAPIDAPDTWQGKPHEPVVADKEVHEKPDWIYDPDREKPDGWDPKLVWKGGDATIDFNYFRDLTKEEQAEYDRLKSIENPEDYGIDVNNEAHLRLMAIVESQTNLMEKVRNARGTIEGDNLFAEYHRLYGAFKYLLVSY